MRREHLARDIARLMPAGGRVFAHVAPTEIGALLEACAVAGLTKQLVAVCVAPTDDVDSMAVAASGLQASGFVLHQLVEKDGEVVLQPATGSLEPGMIAIPAAVLDSSLEGSALPTAS
jgi:hypothetical protein